jgi:hypothetical protein
VERPEHAIARKYGFKLNTKPPKRTDDAGREARQDYLRAVEHDEPPADYQSPPEGSVPRGEAQDHQQQPEEPKRRIRLTWANTITPSRCGGPGSTMTKAACRAGIWLLWAAGKAPVRANSRSGLLRKLRTGRSQESYTASRVG